MKPLAMVHASYLTEIDGWLARQGVDSQTLLEQAGLAAARVQAGEDFFVPTRAAFGWCELVEAAVGLPELGWRVGAEVDLSRFPAFVAARSRASDLQALMSMLVRELRSDTNRMPVWLRPAPDATWFCFGLSLAHDAPGSSFVEQHDLQLFLRAIRAVLGDGWVPARLQVARTSPAAMVAIAEDLPGASIRRGDFAGIAVDRVATRTPMRRGRPPAFRTPRSIAPRDLISSLRAALHAQLAPAGAVPVAEAALLLGTSQRSLQRQLAAAGTTYSEVLEGVRRDIAIELVRDTELRMGDITKELGYSDPAHFTRAFRRWTGCSPRQYRRAAST